MKQSFIPAQVILRDEKYENKAFHRLTLDRLALKQDFFGLSPMGDVESTGGALWDSAVFLASKLKLTSEFEKPTIFSNSVILELGSGIGYMALQSIYAGAKHFIATDGHRETIALLERNMSMNRINMEHISVHQVEWGKKEDTEVIMKQHSKVDFVIGSDLLYDVDAHKSLLSTIGHCCISPHTLLFLTFRVRHPESEESFLQKLCQMGFVPQEFFIDNEKGLAFFQAKRSQKENR